MVKYYVLLVISFIAEFTFCPLFLHFQRPGKCHKSRIMKMITATMYVCQCVLYMHINENKTQFALFMLFGFIASWFGDLFIHINDTAVFFVFGAFWFLSAHILYTVAYIKCGEIITSEINIMNMYTFKYIAAVLLVLFAVILKSGTELKKNVVMGIFVYGLVIVTMCVKAVMLAGTYNHFCNSVYFPVALVSGAVLFLLSDFSLVFLTCSEKFKGNKRLKDFNIWSYFIGQSLLASTVFFMKNI